MGKVMDHEVRKPLFCFTSQSRHTDISIHMLPIPHKIFTLKMATEMLAETFDNF
jgi:hypothetical protein